MTVLRRRIRWLLVTVPLAVIAGCTELAVQAAAVTAAAPSTREAQTRPLDGQKTAITVLAQAAPESDELAAALVQIESLRKDVRKAEGSAQREFFSHDEIDRQTDLCRLRAQLHDHASRATALVGDSQRGRST